MWRLMAFIVGMSDTGSVSMIASHTDWPNEVACRQILQSHYTAPPVTIFNGHEVTVKISASCVPVGLAPPQTVGPPPVGIPPPLANVIPQFFGRQKLAPPCGGRLPCDYN